MQINIAFIYTVSSPPSEYFRKKQSEATRNQVASLYIMR